jgi:hypothetical protein
MLQHFAPIAWTEFLDHCMFHAASYLFCRYAAAPFLFLPRYMFHPSPPQSAVINVLLTHYLLHYL